MYALQAQGSVKFGKQQQGPAPLTRSRSALTFLPPMSMPADRAWARPTRRSSSKICIASSRVGVSTSAPSPSSRPHRARNSASSSCGQHYKDVHLQK
jgi:hypothetical protein